MKKVQSISLSKLLNSEYFELITDLNKGLPGLLPSSPRVDKALENFNSTFVILDTVMSIDRGSICTEPLKLEDLERGDIWRGMDLLIDAYLRSPVEEAAESARVLRRVFDVYGDFRKRSYNAESNDARNLVQDLEKQKNAAHCVQIHLDSWIPLYKGKLENFKALQNERNNEKTLKASGDVRAVRVEMDPLYFEIIGLVNAFIMVGMASPEIENFVRLFNGKLKGYEDTVAMRQGKRNTDTDTEIPDNVDE